MASGQSEIGQNSGRFDGQETRALRGIYRLSALYKGLQGRDVQSSWQKIGAAFVESPHDFSVAMRWHMPIADKCRRLVRIPTQSGRGFRFDVGHRSDLIPATIPK